MICCIKIGPYELRLKNKEVYGYLRDVGLQHIDPPSLDPKTIVPNAGLVYCSSLRRAFECVRIGSDHKLIKTDLLNEIIFDLAKFCSPEEYKINKSLIVRRRFRESFIKDILSMSRAQIFKELKELLTIIKENKKDVTFISHSFRLKLLQAYVKTAGELEQKPELINQYLLDDQRTFNFGESFIISDDELVLI
jgi:hypothetical protein